MGFTFTEYDDTEDQWGTLTLEGVEVDQQLDMACVYMAGLIDSVSISVGATTVCQGSKDPIGSTGTFTLSEQNSSGISGTLERTGTAANDTATYWIVGSDDPARKIIKRSVKPVNRVNPFNVTW